MDENIKVKPKKMYHFNHSGLRINEHKILPFAQHNYRRFLLSEDKIVTIMILINCRITFSKEICSGNEFSRVLFPDNYYRNFYRLTTTVGGFSTATLDRFEF